MSNDNGYNPLRWSCSTSGCFNIKHRPKIEIFAEDLPRRIAFTDVDAVVEINGQFLFMEFKSVGAPLMTGQKIMFERLTRDDETKTVFVIWGDSETMVTDSYSIIRKGKVKAPINADIVGLKARVRSWAMWAQASLRRRA